MKGASDFDWSIKTYGVDETPTSFLLDPEGKSVFKFKDLESLDDVRICDEEVSGLLAYDAGAALHASTTTKSQR